MYACVVCVSVCDAQGQLKVSVHPKPQTPSPRHPTTRLCSTRTMDQMLAPEQQQD